MEIEGEDEKITKTGLLETAPPDKKPKTPEKLDQENERLKAKAYEQDQMIKRLQKQLESAQEEKRKPGITQIDSDGNQMKKKRPSKNPWGLSDLVLPPYTKNRIAIYKICQGDEGINPATGLPVEAVDVLIPGQYTFYDRFEENAFNKDKVIQNVTGNKTVIENGKPKVEQVVDDVGFRRGLLWVSVEQDYNLYVFLELHPNNASNFKHRPSNAPKIFERVDIATKSTASIAKMQDLVLDAGNEVRRMNKEDVISYAAAVPEISTSAGRQVHEIRTDLKAWAMRYPQKFFMLTKNNKANIHLTLLDAINFGLIEYRPNEKSYIFTETEETISTNTASEDPMERLVKFLASNDGKEWYKQIQDRMNYWSND